MRTVKTDNKNPAAKLSLRRHFLRRYHAEQRPHVFDACQASGKLWQILRREFEVASYWGCDLKPRPGGVKVDSVRVLALPGWSFDVIDIDTYGSPWDHWYAALPRIKKPTTLFLTRGQLGMGQVPAVAKRVLGLTFKAKMPNALTLKLYDSATLPMLLAAADHGLDIVEAAEVDRGNSGETRYFGVHVRPRSL
ncbi:MAG: hypothetical protein IT450_18095 [Phycisphaerales bacterium]|nr:hypothetical protein [Phycisphaerales bacterium]